MFWHRGSEWLTSGEFQNRKLFPTYLTWKMQLGRDSDILVGHFSYKGSGSRLLPSLSSSMPSQSRALVTFFFPFKYPLSSVVTLLMDLDYCPTHSELTSSTHTLILTSLPTLQSRELVLKCFSFCSLPAWDPSTTSSFYMKYPFIGKHNDENGWRIKV